MIKKIIAVSVFIIIFASALSISIAGAKNVAQDFGFKDVSFSSLQEDFCTECHGTSLVDTHHETAKAEDGECVFCHSVSKDNGNLGIVLLRDCMTCHLETPHHETEAALDNDCTSCHDSPGLSDYSTDVASYSTSKVTPTTSSCEKCHGDGYDGEMPVIGYEETHHEISLEDCNVCHTGTDTKTTNIRICERCHSVETIHQVAAHVVAENCVACHISE